MLKVRVQGNRIAELMTKPIADPWASASMYGTGIRHSTIKKMPRYDCDAPCSVLKT